MEFTLQMLYLQMQVRLQSGHCDECYTFRASHSIGNLLTCVNVYFTECKHKLFGSEYLSHKFVSKKYFIVQSQEIEGFSNDQFERLLSWLKWDLMLGQVCYREEWDEKYIRDEL